MGKQRGLYSARKEVRRIKQIRTGLVRLLTAAALASVYGQSPALAAPGDPPPASRTQEIDGAFRLKDRRPPQAQTAGDQEEDSLEVRANHQIFEYVRGKLDPYQAEIVHQCDLAALRPHSKHPLSQHYQEINQREKQEVEARERRRQEQRDAAEDKRSQDDVADSSARASLAPVPDESGITPGRQIGGAPVKSVVSLLVSAENENLTGKYIDEMSRLRKIPGVTGGQVVVIGLSDRRMTKATAMLKGLEDPVLKAKMPKLLGLKRKRGREALPQTDFSVLPLPLDTRLISSYGLKEVGFADAKKILKHLGVAHSPTWIVRYKGEDHLFEGRESISGYFTADGDFIRPADFETARSKSSRTDSTKVDPPPAAQKVNPNDFEISLERSKAPIIRYEANIQAPLFAPSMLRELLFAY